MFLFAFTLFISAALLFIIQLMFAKMVLPLLGGTPAVWNTCMVFFQATLLLGYLYADLVAARLKPRSAIPLHLALLALPLLLLPVTLKAGVRPPPEANPIPWLLGLMVVTVGPPFLAVSTTSSVLQKWFSRTDDPAAADPYFLYAASNLGSFFGLLGYILLIEPNFTVKAQTRAWTAGYLVLLALIAAAGVYTMRRARADADAGRPEAPADPMPPAWRQIRWVLLAAVPSSLMLGLTTYISTDLAAVPLLWVAPLSLYLLTFVLAFARLRLFPQRLLVLVLPVFVAWLVLTLSMGRVDLTWMVVVNFTTFFLMSLLMHQELADDRPPASHLTRFYLYVALGGVLGGAFNSLAAPVLFDSIVEYRIALVAGCLLMPAFTLRYQRKKRRAPTAEESAVNRQVRFLVTYVALPMLVLAVVAFAPTLFRRFNLPPTSPVVSLTIGGVIALTAGFILKPYLYGLGVAAIFLGLAINPAKKDPTLHVERTFFGVLRVAHNLASQRIELTHGTTLHGAQSLQAGMEDAALTYYHPTGPIGQAFLALLPLQRLHNVAVVGLGAGSLAAYAMPGTRYTFYEIDPEVVHIATDDKLGAFTFIKRARERGAKVDIVTGDARLRLEEAPDHSYDLIVLDAFSSDAIPVHLMTREAQRLYLLKLAPGGIIAYHISNRHLNLAPLTFNLARDAGLAWLYELDVAREEPGRTKQWDKTTAQWVLVAREKKDFGPLNGDVRWNTPEPDPTKRLWTDDYASILDVLRR